MCKDQRKILRAAMAQLGLKKVYDFFSNHDVICYNIMGGGEGVERKTAKY